ncbi:MAG: LamG domain-containing protein, partial [SAR324 cluster bacterium]|nr:LamG domain-containing protein [SAR324 cluster bacterium]
RINDSNGGIKFGSDPGSVIIPNALKLNEWQNISITNSNGNTKLYVNGILKGNGTISWNQTTNYFSIGCDYCASGSSDARRFFKGRIDKLRIYNRILTSAEINLLNSSDNTTGLGEWVHWTLDDISGSDNVSSRDLSRTGTPSIDNETWSLSGDGTYGQYELNDNDNLSNFSLSIRFKFGTGIKAHSSIFSSEDKNNILGSWQIGMRNSDKMRFFSKQSDGSEDDSVDLNSNKESWFHLVLTKSSSKEIKIFVNATLIDTLQLSNWSMNFLRVGTNRNTTNTWIGNLDDVRIYDYVLDSKDINKLYHNY